MTLTSQYNVHVAGLRGHKHQRHILGFHCWQERKCTHSHARQKPGCRESGMLLQERKAVGSWPKSSKDEEEREYLSVNVPKGLLLSASYLHGALKPTYQ